MANAQRVATALARIFVPAGPHALPKLGAHLPALDGLRGVAILLVLIYHGSLGLGQTGLDRALGFWAQGGWAGVDLFFVLSGFLITGILYDAKQRTGYFKNFYARRFLRIFPLYYAVLTVLLLILPRLPFVQERFETLAGDELWYWLYLSNFSLGLEHAAAPRRLDVFWSLAIEEQFYLVWPLIVLLSGRRRLAAICLGMIGLALAWRTGLVLAGAHPITVYALTPGRLDGLAIGAFIALSLRGGGFPMLLRWARLVALAAGLAVVGLAVAHGAFSPYGPGMLTVGLTLLSVCFGAILVLTLGSPRQGRLAQALEHPILRLFGRYSYALYLFHMPVIIGLGTFVFRPGRLPAIGGSFLAGQAIFYAASIGGSLLLAWLSWHLFEKHFLALKRFFEGQPVATADRQRRAVA